MYQEFREWKKLIDVVNMTNSRRVIEAAGRVSEKLSRLSEKEFKHNLNEHVDGDIANALIDLRCFEVGELEADAFRFEIDQIPIVTQDWHEVTFDYHTDLLDGGTYQVVFATEGINYLTESSVIPYAKSDITPYSLQKYYVASKESEPWPLAA